MLMTRGRIALVFSLAALVSILAGPGAARAILIDNGIVGDGYWEVDALEAGDAFYGAIDPVGFDLTDVIFDYLAFVQVGGGSGDSLWATATSGPTLIGPNRVGSAGSFAGPNFTVMWEAESWIDPASPLYQTRLTFTSQEPFGDMRFMQYLDETSWVSRTTCWW